MLATHISYDFLLKCLVIGEASTGKSCMIYQFIENRFKENPSHTIGVEFGSKILQIGSNKVKLQIWDTAGQERFRSVTKSYYRGAAGALLVYDVSNRDTFDSLPRWLADVRRLATEHIVIVLVGNKSDLEEERKVSYKEGHNFAIKNNIMFLETSAKTGFNINESFRKCANLIISKIETGEINPDVLGAGIQFGNSLSATSLYKLNEGVPTRSKSSSSCC
jgi:Ras-related protein Rab-4B